MDLHEASSEVIDDDSRSGIIRYISDDLFEPSFIIASYSNPLKSASVGHGEDSSDPSELESQVDRASLTHHDLLVLRR